MVELISAFWVRPLDEGAISHRYPLPSTRRLLFVGFSSLDDLIPFRGFIFDSPCLFLFFSFVSPMFRSRSRSYPLRFSSYLCQYLLVSLFFCLPLFCYDRIVFFRMGVCSIYGFNRTTQRAREGSACLYSLRVLVEICIVNKGWISCTKG